MFDNAVFRQYLTAIIASVSAVCAGTSYTWVTPFLLWLTGPHSEIPMTNFEASWVVNAIEIGDLVTPIPVGFIVDKVGRKPLLLLMGPGYIFTWILLLITRSVHILYLVRFIQGMILGVGNLVLPMYLGEIAGSKIRGRIGILVQSMWYVGIVFSFAVGSFCQYQTMIWATLILPLIFFIIFLWFPESPYYLLMREKEEEAEKALMWLRGVTNREGVVQELQDIQRSLAEENENRSTWRDLIRTRVGRRALVLEQLVLVTALMGGIAPVLTYAPVIFVQMNKNSINPESYILILGILILFFAPLSGLLLDIMGRRPVLLISTSCCTFCLVISGIYSYIELKGTMDLSNFFWVPNIAIIVYLIIISCGVEAVFPVLQSELFSNNTRAIASAVTTLSLTIISLASLIMYQTVLEAVGMYMNFFIFAGFCSVGAIFIYFFLPETKGKTFDEIQRLLS